MTGILFDSPSMDKQNGAWKAKSRGIESHRKVTPIHSRSIEEFKQDRFISNSKKMGQIFRLIEKLAKVPDVTVLIEGETGTGKELIAECIHHLGPRPDGPFITLNSGAIPNGLVESELFGYDGGSFTGGLRHGKRGKFEIADGGTILLDEISELPLEAQTKLLRVLETKEFYRVGGTRSVRVDVRVIAASNRSLEDTTRSGQFREDLYYRLNVSRITIPPLRERKEDILPISMFYINKFNEKFGRNFCGFSEEAREILISNPWRGNVRELRNVIERVLLAENDKLLEARHLSFLESSGSGSLGKKSNQFPGELPDEGIHLDTVIRDLLGQAMRKSGGNKAKAARLLGITKPTLLYRLQKYGLSK